MARQTSPIQPIPGALPEVLMWLGRDLVDSPSFSIGRRFPYGTPVTTTGTWFTTIETHTDEIKANSAVIPDSFILTAPPVPFLLHPISFAISTANSSGVDSSAERTIRNARWPE